MTRRLLLGCSAVGNALVEHARDERGGRDDLVAITDDTGWVSTLRDRNVATVEADPTDPGTYPDSAAVVLVASDDAERNVAAARAARERYPAALIVAHLGTAPTAEQRAAVEAVADRVVDPVEAVAGRVFEAVGLDGGRGADADAEFAHAADDEKPARLLSALRGLSGPLLVVAHDNPDPDAIASALGLARIAASIGVDADACYGGEIAHQENRALVNLLDIGLRPFDEVDLDAYGGVALVDHSRAGINDSLPEGHPVDVVVDHHPPRGPVAGSFVDIRPAVGATSTLISEYLSRYGIAPERDLATALLYGIRIDTKDFTRATAIDDFEAAAALLAHADESTLERVESPSVSPETLRVLAAAIENRDVRGPVAASCVGEITDRDALAQAAERLLDLEDVTVTFVYGYMDGVIYGSARARGADLDAGELLRDALDPVGSAGGHASMAGAQVPLGILSEVSESESLPDVVEAFVAGRFFEALADAPAQPTGLPPEFPTD
ncbi:phosphoesterase RecJ domain protein [Halorubrum distributum JCM 9100]|uniref:Phosphoesterase RecJ domain protein n=4 Tax=Halorubrum distributum TaxID=29283 RepID=M0EF79_9EURY|nr:MULTISPECIES: bifunctional oligoribonuclease/PAP phosphatase NrnA [Halorubrum distributum group]ELZ37116.1 phosphoesterase RecJ domain protein [Halorubrum terrestre JCM 10247]ELZ45733.1 phosphoesterase RecJ domain protein [Halorubrum distributum JCM 9100]ELZ50193.1 phosphoesterase RecJ domain protein [Halorubrum distributum JCM 10118]EMA71129.1 phosphoesterase RecJ domain protein [Halorubrum arcis JCM 13916]